MTTIMLIEDDDIMRSELSSFLAKYGYHVIAPKDFQNILNEINKSNADLLLLDINLPSWDGFYICREVRKTSAIPIIVVTSRDSNADELLSLNLGADDFVTKPFDTQILLARIAAILKRSQGAQDEAHVLIYDNLTVNLANGTIQCNGETEEITRNEIRILTCLIQNRGKIVSRDELMRYMWSMDSFVDDNNLSVNIARLRKKLADMGAGQCIDTRRGLGYMMP
ncbi:MAG: response regulator transcription factor [Dehalobacterium sp.]